MAKKEGESPETAKYTKKKILSANRYANMKDVLQAILEEDKTYSIEEVDKEIQKFMEGKV